MLDRRYVSIATPDPFVPRFDAFLRDEKRVLKKPWVRFFFPFTLVDFEAGKLNWFDVCRLRD
jgi:hypothetical protein